MDEQSELFEWIFILYSCTGELSTNRNSKAVRQVLEAREASCPLLGLLIRRAEANHYDQANISYHV